MCIAIVISLLMILICAMATYGAYKVSSFAVPWAFGRLSPGGESDRVAVAQCELSLVNRRASGRGLLARCPLCPIVPELPYQKFLPGVFSSSSPPVSHLSSLRKSNTPSSPFLYKICHNTPNAASVPPHEHVLKVWFCFFLFKKKKKERTQAFPPSLTCVIYTAVCEGSGVIPPFS